MALKAVRHIQVRKGMSVNELVKEMDNAGVVGSGKLAACVNVLERMIKDRQCTNFLGVAGAMVPAGMREIIREMLAEKWFDVFVCSGATLTHDLAEALGFRHFQGSAFADDAKLYRQELVRVYDSYMPMKVYEKMEGFLKKAVRDLKPGNYTTCGLLWHLGKKLRDKNSILATCAKKEIPIFCPAIADCAIGIQLNFVLPKNADISALKDLNKIFNLAWDAKRKGVFYVGGGTPKNYIQQAMQFAPKPADYAVQITTDPPQYGGSSGAELREGISWGKLQPKGKFANLYADATIVLPIITAALKERLD